MVDFLHRNHYLSPYYLYAARPCQPHSNIDKRNLAYPPAKERRPALPICPEGTSWITSETRVPFLRHQIRHTRWPKRSPGQSPKRQQRCSRQLTCIHFVSVQSALPTTHSLISTSSSLYTSRTCYCGVCATFSFLPAPRTRCMNASTSGSLAPSRSQYPPFLPLGPQHNISTTLAFLSPTSPSIAKI